MPSTETPTKLNQPAEGTGSEPDGSQDPSSEQLPRQARSTSRWVDYETHELLAVISELVGKAGSYAETVQATVGNISLTSKETLNVVATPTYVTVTQVGGTATVTGDGTYSPSAGYTPASPGTYWWYASYGGDAANNSTDSTCGQGMTETVVASPGRGVPDPPPINPASETE